MVAAWHIYLFSLKKTTG